jgi:CheY-like chemotaxis protein
MPEGGTVRVQLARVSVETTRVLSHSRLGSGTYLALSVSDEGKGISPAVMERLFEPFFTTREAQSGTGLGLAVVHGVIAEFGGAIDVQGKPGHGARFTLYFPESTEPQGAPAPAPVVAPRGAGQSLLVVDDEPALVALAQEMLSGLGYEPIGFSDSVEALHAVRAQPERFAAVITDEVMPRLNGTQFTEQLRTVAPSVPVLLVSGYGGALLAARAAAVGVTRVLAKPLQRVDLARALADLLR